MIAGKNRYAIWVWWTDDASRRQVADVWGIRRRGRVVGGIKRIGPGNQKTQRKTDLWGDGRAPKRGGPGDWAGAGVKNPGHKGEPSRFAGEGAREGFRQAMPKSSGHTPVAGKKKKHGQSGSQKRLQRVQKGGQVGAFLEGTKAQ